MKCEEIKKLLPDYSLGALSKRKRKFIKQHIDNCPGCERELRYLDETALLLDAVTPEEPPDFLWEGIRREITRPENQAENLGVKFQSVWQGIMSWLWQKRIPALATGLAVLILVTGLYLAPWKSTTESKSEFYAEVEQQTFSYWNSPFADRAALGMLVIKTSMEGENNETLR
jgi:anti-sigma-K factor RskA